MQKNETKSIACQGCAGAFSHLAAQSVFPTAEIVFYPTFKQALDAVAQGDSDAAVVPVENSSAGRVADIHRLLPQSDLYVTGEKFIPVRHCLLGTADAALSDVKTVLSHPQALAQCRANLTKKGLCAQAAANTAEAAKTVAERGDKSVGALASAVAAGLYGLKILETDMQDFDLNMTRFWVLERAPRKLDTKHPITSLIFKVKNVPAVLYKCLGGFATNGVNLLRIESFVDANRFFANAAFLIDVAADSDSRAFQSAAGELAFFADEIKILGTYAADAVRLNGLDKQ